MSKHTVLLDIIIYSCLAIVGMFGLALLMLGALAYADFLKASPLIGGALLLVAGSVIVLLVIAAKAEA